MKVKLEIIEKKRQKVMGINRIYYIVNLDNYYYEYSAPEKNKDYHINDICLDILDVFYIFKQYYGLSTPHMISEFLLRFDYKNIEEAMECINHLKAISNKILKATDIDINLLEELNKIYFNGDLKLYFKHQDLIRSFFDISYEVKSTC